MKKVSIFLAVLCFVLSQSPSFGSEFHTKIRDKALNPPKGLSAAYIYADDENDLNRISFSWLIENGMGEKGQYDCHVDKATKVLSNDGKEIPLSEYSKWEEKEYKAKSAKLKYNYSYHNKKLCTEIQLAAP